MNFRGKVDLTSKVNDGTIPYSFVRAVRHMLEKRTLIPMGDEVHFNRITPGLFEEACVELGFTRHEDVLEYVGQFHYCDEKPFASVESIMTAGIKVLATIYKDTGKYYSSGVVDIGDIENLFDPAVVFAAFAANQKILTTDFSGSYEFYVSLKDTAGNMEDPNYKFTVERLYFPK